MKSIKTNIELGYRGINRNKEKLISPVDLAVGSSHFAGYLVGFLINGFFFIFLFIFLVYFIFYFVFKYLSQNVLSLFLWILPIIVVYFTKLIADYLCAYFIFLQKNGKFLAIDNPKSYSTFIYVMFFIDCFTGFLAALFRLLLGLLGALFFMPRIGYSYLGRQIEEFDTGFQVFNGYLNMEIGLFILFFITYIMLILKKIILIAHSHPVLISFCALLYYKRLSSKFFIHNSTVFLKKYLKNSIQFNKLNSQENMIITKQEIKEFNVDKRKNMIINKWFLYVTLVNNNSLIRYRKSAYSYGRMMGINNENLIKTNRF